MANVVTVLTNYVQYCRHDTSGKILFTTCTSGQVVEWKMHLISLLGTATKLSSRTSGQVFSTRQTELSSVNSLHANRREGTSALHTVYASFYLQ